MQDKVPVFIGCDPYQEVTNTAYRKGNAVSFKKTAFLKTGSPS
jgi:hypothetical protein